ncbi:HNH endonuclease signature motif containing protein [Rhizobium sp. WYCCWR 11128]|uniref:HNH endonuclease n=1 Tax=Rhizobium sp. WYCCWR 11128 TaxID=2749832 RepID=UPI0015D3930C|nr:HNH endonuclease signature motif containing protein [Rhizobium sp. WYCCWR 11128]NYT32045.1 HNH endonuclease [Rhizobium sp. WYCCWR 11128]
MTAVADDPAGLGINELIVEVASFTLPKEKGLGDWVQKAHDAKAAGSGLVFTPLFDGGRVAAWKEGSEDYKSIWLGKFGFNTTQGLSLAFINAAKTDEELKTAYADPAVKKVVDGLAGGLKTAKCDVDHIVEKQMGGTSIPSNLQLLDSTKNQASGRETYQELVKLVDAIRDPSMRGAGVKKLQLRLKQATVPTGTTDGSYVVEKLLREGKVKGSDAVKAAALGKPVALSAGGMAETVQAKDKGDTPVGDMAKRLVPGIRLATYKRSPLGPKGKTDTVEGELDSRALAKSAAGSSAVKLTAELGPAGAPAPAAAPTPVDAPDTTAGAAGASPAGEARNLKLDPKSNKKIAFYYPYLSPGELTSLTIDDAGTLKAEGSISPSVPVLDKFLIKYETTREGKESLALVAPIPAAKLKPNNAYFRFTEGDLSLALAPAFVPSGTLKFTAGPGTKPVIAGDFTVKYGAGAFQANGTLRPGGKLPGIDQASGTVTYHSEKGWAGELKASTSSIPGATIDVAAGFESKGQGMSYWARGGLTTKVRDTVITLDAKWSGGPLSYHGKAVVPDPIKGLVKQVTLEGDYAGDQILLTGSADIVWRSINSKMTVKYSKKDGEEGKFSGAADIDVNMGKATGQLNLNFNEKGSFWGGGAISYQVTKDLRPKLGVDVTPEARIKVLGEVQVNDIELTPKWPKDGGNISIIKGLGFKFPIPTPVPGVTAFGRIEGSLGLGYGVGPIILKAVVFNGSLYPMEDDPKVEAKLTGRFAVPAYAELYGVFGARLGVEVAAGAAGLEGGIDIKPSLRIDGEGGVKFDSAYKDGGFDFSASAYAEGRLTAKAKVDLVATIYALWRAVDYSWTYNVASVEAQIGPTVKLSLGTIAYGHDGKFTWPSLDQIKVDPEVDPLQVVKDMAGRGKAVEK